MHLKSSCGTRGAAVLALVLAANQMQEAERSHYPPDPPPLYNGGGTSSSNAPLDPFSSPYFLSLLPLPRCKPRSNEFFFHNFLSAPDSSLGESDRGLGARET